MFLRECWGGFIGGSRPCSLDEALLKRSIQSATIGIVVSSRETTGLLSISVNGSVVRVGAGSSVAAAILQAGAACHLSVSGEPRGPLCGMGICMECRATVDDVPHARTCQMTVCEGMRVVTG
jgi:D-hydroxyproline dehydrogenase subunit gamma